MTERDKTFKPSSFFDAEAELIKLGYEKTDPAGFLPWKKGVFSAGVFVSGAFSIPHVIISAGTKEIHLRHPLDLLQIEQAESLLAMIGLC